MKRAFLLLAVFLAALAVGCSNPTDRGKNRNLDLPRLGDKPPEKAPESAKEKPPVKETEKGLEKSSEKGTEKGKP
jgi:hypothetical protein